ncbi:hypothetical protein [Acidisphaera sp. S103]|uniref:hypothetical protein n=1 Tax=Acidisphaera sp. S103 TaxID=1747223 RepID=UPI00131D31E8|nr:hypothetical protein [Acidisphaera sp. S103]
MSDFAKVVLAMLGIAAKLERHRVMARITRGRSDAKAKGVKFDRKPIRIAAPAEGGLQADRGR